MTTSKTIIMFGALAVALASCKNERAITTAPIGNLGYGAQLGKTSTNLPRGRVIYPFNPIASATPATDSVVLTLGGLDSLSGSVYSIWAGNDSGTKFAKLTGNLLVSRLDTTLNAQGDPVFTSSFRTYNGISSFPHGGQNSNMRFVANRTTIAGLAAGDSLNTLLISIEASDAATAPSTKRIMWSRRSEAAIDSVTLGVAPTFLPRFRTGGMRFGNYSPQVANQYVFATTANFAIFANIISTMAIIPRGRIEFRGPLLVVNDSNYARPPVGYYYAAWAIKQDTLGRFVDTIPLGDKSTPYPKRLTYYDADTSVPDNAFMYGSPGTVPVIVAAAHRVSADTIPPAKSAGKNDWFSFGLVYVTLQNKLTPKERMGTNVVMVAGVPVPVFGR